MPSTSPEIFRTGYQTLFEVHLLHRYFLNVGLTEFDQAPDDAAVQAVRQAYDVRRFLRIEPSPATRELLRNQRLLFRLTPEGFCVLMATTMTTTLPPQVVPEVPFPLAASFAFYLHLTDPDFFLYTIEPYPPRTVAPRGQLLGFRNFGPGLVQGAETLRVGIEPLPAGIVPPLGIITITHDMLGGDRKLLSTSGGPDGRHFQYVLRNQTTIWEYQGPQVAYQGHQLGQFPLVRHGRIAPTTPLPFAVAAPTAATTVARPDGSYSLIY